MKATLGQLLRYGTVGVLSNLVGYLLYLAITSAGVEHKLTMSLLYVVGVVQTFFFNRRWSFRHHGAHGPAMLRYGITYALGYLFNLWALWLLVDVLGHPHQFVQAAMVFVVAALLFVLQKFWVFRSAGTDAVPRARA